MQVKNPLQESDNLEKDKTKMKISHLPVTVVCAGRNLVSRQITSHLATQRIVHFLYWIINLNLKKLLVLAILVQIWRMIDHHRQVSATHLIHLLCCYKVPICTLYSIISTTPDSCNLSDVTCAPTDSNSNHSAANILFLHFTFNQPNKPDYRFPTTCVSTYMT